MGKHLGKVRRIHVIALGVLVLCLTLLNAPFSVIDYPAGVMIENPVRLPIWAKGSLRIGRLLFELVIEAVVIGYLYKNARK